MDADVTLTHVCATGFALPIVGWRRHCSTAALAARFGRLGPFATNSVSTCLTLYF